VTFGHVAFLVLGASSILVFALWASAGAIAEAIRESIRHADYRELSRQSREDQSAIRGSLNPRAETPSVRGR